jgi:hypothetical protein
LAATKIFQNLCLVEASSKILGGCLHGLDFIKFAKVRSYCIPFDKEDCQIIKAFGSCYESKKEKQQWSKKK